MTHLSSVSWQDVAKALQRAGFHIERQRGSHMLFVQTETGRAVTVPRHSELKPGAVNAILRQSGLSREDLGR